jgi:hypothetical protein
MPSTSGGGTWTGGASASGNAGASGATGGDSEGGAGGNTRGGASGSTSGGSTSGGSTSGGSTSGGSTSGGAGGIKAGGGLAGAAGTTFTGGNGGSGGEAGTGTSPAAALDKFRFECPCKSGAANHTSDGNCNVTPEVDRQTIVKTMGGDPTKVYDVTLRVRGLTEPNTYKNGTLQGDRFYVGGTTGTPGYTSYMMTTADPAQHYFFNFSPTTGHVHFKLDYQVTVKIRGGSRVTFDVDGDGSVPDGHQVSNFDQTVVADVPPAPVAYDGQFIQLDVVSAVVAP